jgi:crotonobetainyl-CoA:carnitine CoA-transferase CaiB-like acyl-CoA transferase
MTGALSGIRIIDWGAFHHGMGGSYMLGDLGADVIHIEDRIKGDMSRGVHSLYGSSTLLPKGRNVLFETTNRNKKSITLDVTKEKGREIVYDLVKNSDVFLTNFRQEAALKHKLDYETLTKYNPKIIYAFASAYGSKGPLSKKRGFDPIGLANSGIMWRLGDRDQDEPLQPCGFIADSSGATMAAYGILAALVARERLGIGQFIEVSLLGSMIHMQSANVNSTLFTGRPFARHSRARSRNPLSNMYKCSDDKWLILAEPQSNTYWDKFCTAMNKEELREYDDEMKRGKNCEFINSTLADIFITRTRNEWLAILEKEVGEMVFNAILDITDLPDHPQVLENQYIVDVPDYPADADIKMVGFPVKFSATPCRIQRPAPEWGEHTEAVLMDVCGYDWERIGQLKEEEVI